MAAVRPGGAHARPPKVRLALLLLWSSIALSLVDSLLAWESPPEDFGPVFGPVMTATVFVPVLVWSWLLVLVSRGRHWARVAMLVVLIATCIAVGFVWLSFPVEGMDASSATLIATTVMDAVALALLFSKEGSAWFRSMRRGADPEQPHQ